MRGPGEKKDMTIALLAMVRPPIVTSVLGMRAVRCSGPS